MAKAHTGLPVASTTCSPRGRRSATGCTARRPSAPRRSPQQDRRPGRAQGGALPADGLVQAARDAERARALCRRGEGARRHHDLRRQRGAGPRLLRGARGHRLPRRHVAGASAAKHRGDARLRRRGRPRGGRRRPRRSSAWNSSASETGRAFVHSFDDPHLIAGHGTLGLELLEDVPDLDIVVVPIGGGGLISGIATAVKGAAPEVRVVGVSSRSSRPRCTSRSRPGEPVTVEPKLDRRRAQRPVRRREHARDLPRARGRDGPRLGGARSRRRIPLPLRAREACLRARRRRVDGRSPGRKGPRRPGRNDGLRVVSGGNVAPQTAVAILAEE